MTVCSGVVCVGADAMPNRNRNRTQKRRNRPPVRGAAPTDTAAAASASAAAIALTEPLGGGGDESDGTGSSSSDLEISDAARRMLERTIRSIRIGRAGGSDRDSKQQRQSGSDSGSESDDPTHFLSRKPAPPATATATATGVTASAPKAISGYHFDPVRNKYFAVPNARKVAPSAMSDVQHELSATNRRDTKRKRKPTATATATAIHTTGSDRDSDSESGGGGGRTHTSTGNGAGSKRVVNKSKPLERPTPPLSAQSNWYHPRQLSGVVGSIAPKLRVVTNTAPLYRILRNREIGACAQRFSSASRPTGRTPRTAPPPSSAAVSKPTKFMRLNWPLLVKPNRSRTPNSCFTRAFQTHRTPQFVGPPLRASPPNSQLQVTGRSTGSTELNALHRSCIGRLVRVSDRVLTSRSELRAATDQVAGADGGLSYCDPDRSLIACASDTATHSAWQPRRFVLSDRSMTGSGEGVGSERLRFELSRRDPTLHRSSIGRVTSVKRFCAGGRIGLIAESIFGTEARTGSFQLTNDSGQSALTHSLRNGSCWHAALHPSLLAGAQTTAQAALATSMRAVILYVTDCKLRLCECRLSS